MKQESSPRANDILRRVRGSADPRPRDEARVLARVEQRLAGLSELEVLRAPAPDRMNASARGRVAATEAQSPLHGVLSAVRRVGLWAAFGVSMTAIGYAMGTRDHGREVRQEVARVARAIAQQPARITPPAPPVLAVPPLTPAPVVAAPVALPPEPSVLPEPPAALSEPPAELSVPSMPSEPPAALMPPAPHSVPSMPSAASKPAASLSKRGRRTEAAARSSLRFEDGGEESKNRLVAPTAASAPSAARVVESKPIDLREALQLLEHAQAAVRLGTAGDALDWLAQLERRNPERLLEQERLVTRALALCALGEVLQARAARRDLERLEPESIYRGQLDASCAKKE